MLADIRGFIRRNRRNAALQTLASGCEKYLRAYFNEDFWTFEENGEAFVMRQFAARCAGRPCIVWDVGANKGSWAETCHTMLPQAQITSFEIVPAMCDILQAKAASEPWWTVERTGLSSAPGMVDVTFNRDNDSTSSIVPHGSDVPNDRHATARTERITCPVTTLDDYWKTSGAAPMFLKIDVEGFDGEVLRGGSALMSSPEGPLLIQFEYGSTWLRMERLLGPVQRLLESAGYAVGRVFPDHVAFKPYELVDEHFRMGNMVAVRDEALRALLANGG
jgi:FkbM family methyltransferase